MAQKRANLGVCFATFETIVAFDVIRDVVSLPKSSARAPASDVHAALRNNLAIKVCELLDRPNVGQMS